MSIAFVVLMYALWSSVFPIGKMILQHCPPVFLTGTRMLLAGVILLVFLLIRRRKDLKVNKVQFLSIIVLSVFSIYLPNILEFWSLTHLSAAKTCFIYSLSPFFAAIFSYIHFKEKVNVKKCIGFLIGFVGFIPVLLLQTGSEDLLSAFSIFSWPEIAVMGAALFSVYGWVILRLIVKKHTVSPLTANGYSMLIGGIFALVHSSLIDTWAPTPIAKGYLPNFVQGILILTLISNIICYNLYGYLLRKFTATFLSFVGLLSPIFASLSSWILLGETPSPIILLSTGIVSIGLFLVYQAELKQGYIQPAKAPASA